MVCLKKAACAAEFPLMSVIHDIAFEGKDPSDIIKINN